MRLQSHSVRLLAFTAGCLGSAAFAGASGWHGWRGPDQNGVSTSEVPLPDALAVDGPNHRWAYSVQGAGTPVIADGRVYAFGFYGQTTDVVETLLCIDNKTGKKIWEHTFRDFLSDNVYNRYAIGAPTVDPDTGNVYVGSTPGLIMGFTRDGKKLWERSIMEEFGAITFPNGRTGAPAIDGDLVIINCISGNWGADGPARNRFYAFDKLTGELVWTSTPGLSPIDSSFATPVFADLGNQRVFYVGTGCGNIVCVNARTGAPVWRFQLASGGVNSDVLLLGNDRLIAVHGKENIDSTNKGRLVCLKIPTEYPAAGSGPIVLGPEAELWRNDEHVAFSSSPILVDGRVYTTIATGSLLCADAETGATLWRKKLAPDQLHASPGYADGKLYIPMLDGTVHVIKPDGSGGTVVSVNELGAPCLGAPAFYEDEVFIFTKEALHCFGPEEKTKIAADKTKKPKPPALGEITQIQVVPSEFALAPGEEQAFTVYGLDATGRRVRKVTDEATLEKWSPPNAPGATEADVGIEGNVVQAGADAALSVGLVRAKWKDLTGVTRGRVVAGVGYNEDFESFALPLKNDEGESVNFPPLPWLGARVKWHVLEHDGSKVAANRLDVVLFQRTMNFVGKPDMSEYTFEADVMTDGTRRVMSTVGVINQRYLIALSGNQRLLEISSNHERYKESVPFPIKANTWYRLKTSVELDDAGGGWIRAKAWERETDEPDEWTIERHDPAVHAHGAPGVFAFSPQSLKRVYIDNLSITAND